MRIVKYFPLVVAHWYACVKEANYSLEKIRKQLNFLDPLFFWPNSGKKSIFT